MRLTRMSPRRRPCRRGVALVLAGALLWLPQPPAAVAQEAPGSQPSLTVIDIVNTTNDPHFRALANRLSFVLLDLEDLPHKFRWIKRTQVQEAVATASVKASQLQHAHTLQRLGKSLGASHLLVGSLRQTQDKRLTMTLALAEADSGEKKEEITIANLTPQDIGKGVECLALNMSAEKLGLQVEPSRLAELNTRFQPRWSLIIDRIWWVLGGSLLAVGSGIVVYGLTRGQGGEVAGPSAPPTTTSVKFGW